MDYVKGIHRGFAFVEYESADDADEAIFNLDGAELLGQTIAVSVAQPNQIHRLSTTTSIQNNNNNNTEHGANTMNSRSKNEAIWTSDEWFQKQTSGGMSREDVTKRQQEQEDLQTLQSI
jgi:peptidyl-prolyl isomerase E (cyclophilin E)